MSRPLSISLRLNLLFLIILALVLVGGGAMLFVVIAHQQDVDRHVFPKGDQLVRAARVLEATALQQVQRLFGQPAGFLDGDLDACWLVGWSTRFNLGAAVALLGIGAAGLAAAGHVWYHGAPPPAGARLPVSGEVLAFLIFGGLPGRGPEDRGGSGAKVP